MILEDERFGELMVLNEKKADRIQETPMTYEDYAALPDEEGTRPGKDRLSKLKSYARYGIPEYWIVDPEHEVLEQYVLAADRYELREVYEGETPVRSERIRCVSFTMNRLMSRIPELP